MEKKIQFCPYNDYFFNCLVNNLIAILRLDGDKYSKIPFFIKHSFSKQCFSGKELPHQDKREGYYFPEVHFDHKFILSFFDIKEIKIQRFDELSGKSGLDVINLIIESINEDYYPFVTTDRFFYPQLDAGIEAAHMIHPAFYYGYSTNDGLLYLIEDYIRPGYFDYFQLPINKFIESCDYILGNRYRFKIFAVKKKRATDIPNMTFTIDTIKELWKSNFNEIDKNMYGQTYRKYGFASIEMFLSEFACQMNDVENFNIPRIRLASFIQLSKRNLDVASFIRDNEMIKPSISDKMYALLKEIDRNWNILINNFYYVFLLKESNLKLSNDRVESLRLRLGKVLTLEKEIATLIQEKL